MHQAEESSMRQNHCHKTRSLRCWPALHAMRRGAIIDASAEHHVDAATRSTAGTLGHLRSFIWSCDLAFISNLVRLPPALPRHWSPASPLARDSMLKRLDIAYALTKLTANGMAHCNTCSVPIATIDVVAGVLARPPEAKLHRWLACVMNEVT